VSWEENARSGWWGQTVLRRKGKMKTGTRCETKDTEMSLLLTQKVTHI